MNEEDILKQIQEYMYNNRVVDRLPNMDTSRPVYTDSYSLPQLFSGFGQRVQQDMNKFPDSNDDLFKLINSLRRGKTYGM